MMVDCSVGIVTYNNERTIEGTLQALIDYWPPEVRGQVIVVDNDSTDRSWALAEQLIRRHQANGERTGLDGSGPVLPMQLHHSAKGNCGYGCGQNQVLDRIDSRVHLIMNPDIIVRDGTAIAVLMNRLDREPDLGLIMPKIVDPAGQVQYLARRDLTILDLMLRYLPGRWFAKRLAHHAMRDQDYNQPFDIEFASGCLMAIRTQDFRACGGFDPRYFLYAEDADLSKTVRAMGLRILYEPAAVVEHAWSRGSYRSLRLFGVHFRSLWHYFRKWGFRWF